MYKVVILNNWGSFIFQKETYEDAIKFLEDRWFSPDVYDIALFKDTEEIDVSDLIKSWGNRPIYC